MQATLPDKEASDDHPLERSRTGLLVAVLVVGAAQAKPPVIVPAPFVDFTDTTTCGFPLEVHFTVNGQMAKIFSDGTIIVTGPVKATYSANGRSVSLNIPGPTMISPSGAATGIGVGAGPTELPNGELTFGYLAGQVEIDFTAGIATLVHGHLLLDICATLEP